jgi:hypothetical protein
VPLDSDRERTIVNTPEGEPPPTRIALPLADGASPIAVQLNVRS